VPGNLTLQWYRWALVDNLAARHAIGHSPVSYTHLTLPTICSV